MLRAVLLVVVLMVLAPVAAAGEERALGEPAWWLDRAAEAARTIDTPDGRAASLVSVAAGWLEAGEKTKAKAALEEALGFADACQGCFGKVQRLVDVGLMQHEAGDAKGARKTLERAQKAAESVKRAEAFAAVGGGFRHVGDRESAASQFEAAEALAAKLEPVDRLEMLGRIAIAQEAAGDSAGATATLERLRPLIEGTEDEELEEVFGGVMAALADVAVAGGEAKQACRYADSIQLPLARAEALLAVARATDDDGLATAALARAGEAAGKVGDAAARLLLIGDAAAVFASRGATGEAKRLLGTLGKETGALEDAEARLEVMLRHAVGLAAAGDVPGARASLGAARELAEAHTTARSRGVVLEALVAAACEAGLLAEAEKTASEIGALRVAVRAYGTLADEQLRRGDLAGARRSLLWLDAQLGSWPETLERRKDEVLRAVAVIDARVGRLEEARKRFEAIESAWHRAAAATYVARALIGEK